MMRCGILITLAAAGALGLRTVSDPPPEDRPPLPWFTVEMAPEWTDVFDRTSGWTGADGIFSIPLAGIESAGATGQSTAFVFSDTFIGDVNPNGTRAPGARLVNNTVALLSPSQPRHAALFPYWRTVAGQPAAVFVPNTPNAAAGDWYWPQDHFVNRAVGGSVSGLHLRVRSTGTGGAFGFQVVGVSLVTMPVGSVPPFANHTQVETPFFLPAQGARGEMAMGSGIFVNTGWAGVPDPDGYVYVYGVESVPFNKHLLVARVLPQDFENLSAWRFFDGTGWSPQLSAAVRVTDRVSPELSLTPLRSGQYALVFQKDTLGRWVSARVGPTPMGPFGPMIDLYECPEGAPNSGLFVYNAKGHPHLSEPGTLLVSYNVNAMTFGAHFANADIYRPRFIRIRF